MLTLSSILRTSRSYLALSPKISPTRYCVENLQFNEPDNHSPFRLEGNYYIQEPLDSFADFDIAERIMIWGRQCKKTGTLMGAAGYLADIVKTRIFWTMPTIDNARKFSRHRFMPMCRESRSLRDLIPKGGQARHNFKTLEIQLGGSVIDFTGSNSLANLKSTPARCVFQDEIDEFKIIDNDMNPVNAADGRCMGQSQPIKCKTSTPKLWDGQAWRFLLKSDLRRRFVPCPFCAKMLLLVFSKQYSDLCLPPHGCEAEIIWDKEAKKKDGTWDLHRVEKSARFECPFCHGHILDNHKTVMDRNGEWRPTQADKASRGYVGWHLPSFYANSTQTTCGKIAVKFLEEKHSLVGIADVVTDYFALPYMGQDSAKDRKERIMEKFEVNESSRKLMTIDCQERAPYFWYVVRQWIPGVSSCCVRAGHCDSWEDLEKIQKEEGVVDAGVLVDSGFGAKSDAEVYRHCANHGELKNRLDKLPVHIGWTPSKGMPINKKWLDTETKVNKPFRLWPIDPYTGTAAANKVEMLLFEFSNSFFQDILESLRKDGERWSVLKEVATDEYWRHIDGSHKIGIVNKRNGLTTYAWTKRNTRWPDHLRDAEVMQLALAAFFELYKLE
jgi:hypothetical protein